MFKYAIKRLVTVIPVLLGVSLLVFSFVHLIPGDPAVTMLGERATPERVVEIRARLGLDQPLISQYLGYLGRSLQGDLGHSILRGEPVAREILRRFPATVELAISAMAIALLLGVPAGIVSAVWRNSALDIASRIVTLTGVSLPIFWLGLVLAWFFGVTLGWLPTGFRLDADVSLAPLTQLYVLDSIVSGNWAALRSSLRHLVLPAVALGTIPLAVIARATRAGLLEVLSREYIRTAEAKGCSPSAVVLSHALRNALLPILTVTGLQAGSLLAGAILTETIFSWPGIGLWVYDAIQARDYPIVQGAALFIATLFVLINLVSDLLYAIADPRVRYE
jgi:peptide/nickel transport system permease protein